MLHFALLLYTTFYFHLIRIGIFSIGKLEFIRINSISFSGAPFFFSLWPAHHLFQEMASFTRNFIKLSQCMYTSATRKATQNSRYFSSMKNKNNCGSALIDVGRRTGGLKSSDRVPCITDCSGIRRSHHQTDGDRDLLTFLKEEISFEEENIKKVPKLKDFKMNMDGTFVTLLRNFNSEKIEVKFDCNDSLNVDDSESMNEEDESENESLSDIVSYPSFTVRITKPSGNTLVFNCNCNTGINEEDDMDGDSDDEQFDLLRFDTVQIYNSGNLDKSKAYEVESESMDGELYSMLINTLLERGINGTFVNDLIDLSTSVEHRHYLNFLKSLGDYMKE